MINPIYYEDCPVKKMLSCIPIKEYWRMVAVRSDRSLVELLVLDFTTKGYLTDAEEISVLAELRIHENRQCSKNGWDNERRRVEREMEVR